MAIPATPGNVVAQQGNSQVLITWNNSAGATSYSVKRSIDNVTFSVLGTATVNSYTDSTVTV